jgi:mono/diheme cytochrome c family protein
VLWDAIKGRVWHHWPGFMGSRSSHGVFAFVLALGLSHVTGEFPPPIGFFRDGPQIFNVYGGHAIPSPFDEFKPLEDRARAYLDRNCAACHNPKGVLQGKMDLRFATPMAQTGLLAPSSRRDSLGFVPRIRPGKPGESEVYRRLGSMGGDAMPPTGRTSLDEPGLALIRAWIEDLSPSTPLADSPRPIQTDSAKYSQAAQTKATGIRMEFRQAGTRFQVSRAPGEPEEPPEIRVCDALGACRVFVPETVAEASGNKGWVLRPSEPLRRGLHWVWLRWPQHRSLRFTLVY